MASSSTPARLTVRHAADLHRRGGEVGAGAAARVAARRHGGSDARLRAHARGDDGRGWRLPRGAALLPVRAVSGSPHDRRVDGWDHRAPRGRLMAFVQHDIKKVLAYSTLSQLGYMVMALGFLVRPPSAMFHLTTHACLQGAALPRLGLRDPRLPPRAGHAPDGRPGFKQDARSLQGRSGSGRWRSRASSRSPASGRRTRSSERREPSAMCRAASRPLRDRRCAVAFMTAAYMGRQLLPDVPRRVPRPRGTPRVAEGR